MLNVLSVDALTSRVIPVRRGRDRFLCLSSTRYPMGPAATKGTWGVIEPLPPALKGLTLE